MKAYTSTIAWGEVVWVIRKIFNFELSLEQERCFLEFPNLKFLSVKKSTILVAHKLLERYKLKPRDALHAAVAIENGLTEIVSYDIDFDVLKELKRTINLGNSKNHKAHSRAGIWQSVEIPAYMFRIAPKKVL